MGDETRRDFKYLSPRSRFETDHAWPVQIETVVSINTFIYLYVLLLFRLKALGRSGIVDLLIMRSLVHILAIHITCLICFLSLVSAFSGRLAKRQETCDTYLCAPNVSWDGLVDTLGAWFYDLSQPDGYLQPGTLPPETETQPTKADINTQIPNTRQDPNNLPTSNTDIELLQLAPYPGSNECQRAPSSADYPSDNSVQNDEVNHFFQLIINPYSVL